MMQPWCPRVNTHEHARTHTHTHNGAQPHSHATPGHFSDATSFSSGAMSDRRAKYSCAYCRSYVRCGTRNFLSWEWEGGAHVGGSRGAGRQRGCVRDTTRGMRAWPPRHRGSGLSHGVHAVRACMQLKASSRGTRRWTPRGQSSHPGPRQPTCRGRRASRRPWLCAAGGRGRENRASCPRPQSIRCVT
jgi:hypothetical protein